MLLVISCITYMIYICFQIQCQCPVDEMTGSSATTEIAGTTTDSSEAKTIYHFTCGFGGFGKL